MVHSPSGAVAGAARDLTSLVEELTRHGLVQSDPHSELNTFAAEDVPGAVQHLVLRGLLSAYQAEKVLEGQAGQLVVGRFRVVDRLPEHRGWLARAVPEGGEYLLRLLPMRSLWQARQAKKLIQGQSLLRSHPVWKPLVEVDTVRGRHYLAWPWPGGRSLEERIRQSRLSPVEAARLLRSLAEALDLAHRHGIEHGGLSIRCVRLDDTGQPRLLDLGLAHLVAHGLVESESLFDTSFLCRYAAEWLRWAAPELQKDPTAFSPAADQYGLGLIACSLLKGPSPSSVTTATDRGRLAGIRTREDPSSPVPPPLAAIVDRMLAEDPADRFLSLLEVSEALAGFLADVGEPAAVESMSEEDASQSKGQVSLRQPSRLFGSSSSSSMTWVNLSGTSMIVPVERDDSDDSIRFDDSPKPDPAEGADFPWVVKPSPPGPTGPLCEDRSLLDSSSSRAVSGSSPVERPDKPAAATTRPSERASPLGREFVNPGAESVPGGPEAIPAPREMALDKGYSPPRPAGPPAPPPKPEDTDSPKGSKLLKSVMRNVLFWQSPADTVQLSIFGPPAIMPGSTVGLTLYFHSPEIARSVGTMVRALSADSRLLGRGSLAQEVKRESSLAVHLALTEAVPLPALSTAVWRGQPLAHFVQLHVPWESPPGLFTGVISVGQNNVRIGRIEFQVQILPRTG